MTLLNIGSNDKTLPGFVNVDIEPLGDVCADVTHGLPFASGSVEGIFSEHFIEHIDLHDGIAFLRECRRVLVPGGRCRVATPDLPQAMARYLEGTWRQGDMFRDGGWAFVQTGAEQFNIAMREWGHQWIYDEEELRRVGHLAGLRCTGRMEHGHSDDPRFAGLEYRPSSNLILEFVKDRPAVRDDQPLVSVLIPAFRPEYLDEALASARAQTWREIEILVGDDSPDPAVAAIIDQHAAEDDRVRRIDNGRRGARANHVALVEASTGEYVKFLSDDDLLDHRCVERMASCLDALPEVTLVTSHRQRVDEVGRPLPDDGATERRVVHDSIIDGVSAVDVMLRSGVNWIGEPTTAMFRRRDLDDWEADLFCYLGRPAPANGDVTAWVQLLARGDLVYLVESLSSFRQHTTQTNHDPAFRSRAMRGWDQIRHDAARTGLVRSGPMRLSARELEIRPWWDAATMAELRLAEAALEDGNVAGAVAALEAAVLASGGDHAVAAMLRDLLAATAPVG